MALPRYLIFSSPRRAPDPWGEWLWQLVAELVRQDVRPEVVLSTPCDATNDAAITRSLEHGVVYTWLRPRRLCDGLFDASDYDELLRTFLAEQEASGVHYESAIIHRWQGHGAMLAPRLQLARIPTVAFLEDAWPVCPRRELYSAQGETCRTLDRTRCMACVAATWPELAGQTTGWDEAAMRQARTSLDAPDLILAATRSVRPLLDSLGITRSRALGFPTSVQVTEPCVHRVRRPQADAAARCRVGFIGELSPPSGVDVLLDAFEQLPSDAFELRLFGPLTAYHGHEAGRAARAARIRTANVVHDSTAWNTADLPGMLDQIDVLVAPELFGEPTAVVAEVALRRGVFLVASSETPGVRYVEHGVNGYEFRCGSATALRDALVDCAALLGQHEASLTFPIQSPIRIVSDLLEICRRLPLPPGAPRGISHWSADLGQRVHVVYAREGTSGALAYPMRWRDGAWQADATPRHLQDADLLRTHVARMLETPLRLRREFL